MKRPQAWAFNSQDSQTISASFSRTLLSVTTAHVSMLTVKNKKQLAKSLLEYDEIHLSADPEMKNLRIFLCQFFSLGPHQGHGLPTNR